VRLIRLRLPVSALPRPELGVTMESALA
jgi:hypothetical protein